MSLQILTTKLYIPSTRSELVSRPHLIDRLNQGLRSRLTLVCAPAGFGKTTIITEWLSQCERRSAWLSLDEQDNDPTRFLMYVIAALQTIDPNIGDDLLKNLQSPQPPAIDTLLIPLINALATMSEDFILVLDDYHMLDTREIDAAVAYLLDNLPPQMHIVITTREDPQLPLARLRARGYLTEIRARDLRFTADEAALFLNQSLNLSLSEDHIVALEKRTEGWIAGLQLAALSMQGRDDIEGFIQNFAGDHRYIVDYLVDEVLQHQPSHIQDFLLQTSILERLTPSLCAAVTNQDEAKDLLEALERSNLFVIHLDDERQWYRYHHLFGDVLHSYLIKEHSEQIPVLHRRASEWYEQNGWQRDAIRHTLTVEDFERAADLVEMTWPGWFKGYRPTTWLGWVQALPDDIVKNRPILNLGGAWTLLHKGELEEAERYLRAAERWLDTRTQSEQIITNEDALASLPPLIANARVYLCQSLGDLSGVQESARRVFGYAAEDNSYYRGLAQLFLGLGYWASGDLPLATQTIRDAIANMRLAKNSYFEASGLTFWAAILSADGQLQAAKVKYEQSLRVVIEGNNFALRKMADRYIGLSEIYYEWNDLQTAKQLLQDGHQEMLTQAIFPGREARWYSAMAQIKTAEGDFDTVLELLHEAEQHVKRDVYPAIRPLSAHKARIWIKQGRLSETQNWAIEQGLAISDDMSYIREYEHITLARLLIAQNKYDDAQTLLKRLLDTAEEDNRVRSCIEILVLQAISFHQQDNSKTASEALKRAVALAAPEGFVRIFLNEGEPVHQLLIDLAQQNFMPDYTQKLLNTFDTELDITQIPANQALVEPLSERELEILQLVANGLSNREISDKLYLALSTVKGHNGNIYGKLGVSRRTEAIALARELGLISD